MEAHTAGLHTGKKLGRPHTKRDEEVEPSHPNHKKRYRVESGESTEPARKSPRLHPGQRRSAGGKVLPQPSRKIPRLREKRDLNQQVERTGGQQKELPGLDCKISPVKEDSKRLPKRKEEPKPSLTRSEGQKNLKHSRGIGDGGLPNHDAKRPNRNDTAESNRRIDHSKEKFVKAWLSSTDDENPLGELDLVPADDMPLPSPDGSGASTALTSPSAKSDKSSVGPYDADFRDSLGYRNIYINRKKPPMELIRRARAITMGPRSSPEVDEATAEDVKELSRALETAAEEDIIQKLATRVISAMIEVPDERLESNAGQQWTNFVPVPLDSSILTNPLPLSRPKPDKAFGYSKRAFTRNQLATIDLLTEKEEKEKRKDNLSGRSYAVPYKGLHFPFFDIEYKAQAKGGTHYIAANEAANAGAVVGHGLVELTRRASGLDSIDYNEPQFFSLSFDHTSVYVYVHWLAVESGQFSFHVEMLSLHNLRDLDGLRAIQRTVKNILDWGRKERLTTICKHLDVYRKKVQIERAAAERAAAAATESAPMETELQNGQKRKRRKPKNTNVNVTALNAEAKEPRPAPPLILSSARALADFIPAPEKKSELGFKEGQTIEFANAKADEHGWLRGRIKDGDGRWGRVPAAYLEL